MFGYTLAPWARNSVLAILVFAVGLTLLLQANSTSARAPSYVKDLQAISSQLSDADKRGDKALAGALMDDATALLSRMNQDPAPPAGKRYCQLAAQQLLEGVLDVYEGGTWYDRKRFEANMESCS